MIRVLLCVALLVAVVLTHPTYYPGVANKFNNGNLADYDWPPYRSYHVHVIFQLEHQSDSCTGYDEAMMFRDAFVDHFGISDIECEGDFDQGRLCMFPTALAPFGPFPVPQWAAFVPLEDYPRVVPWLTQNRGPFSVFVHPNSGFERNDHRDWGMWAGQPWFLDLSAPEFVNPIESPYPSDCRNVGDLYPIPNQTKEYAPNTGVAHVRGFNANNDLRKDDRKIFFQQLDGEWITPFLGHFENTWYLDSKPASSSTYAAYFEDGKESELIGKISIPNGADTWHTLLVNDLGSIELLSFVDDNTPIAGKGKLRFINLQDKLVYVSRNNARVTDNLTLNVASKYIEDLEGQYIYQVRDALTDDILVTEPYYMNTENVVTAFLVNQASRENPDLSILLIQDYPHDAPRFANERQP